jgi:hypothetical protein
MHLRFGFSRVCMNAATEGGGGGGGTTTPPAATPPAATPPPAGGGSAAPPATEQQPPATQQPPAQNRQHVDVSRLRAENLGLRTLLEQNGIQIPDAAPPAAGSPPPTAAQRREEDDLRARLDRVEQERTQERTQLRQQTIRSRVASIAAEGKFNATNSAIRELSAFATIDDDGAVVFEIPDPKAQGGKRRVEATLAAVTEHNLLDPIFLPSPGASGAGSSGGAAAALNGAPQAVVTHGLSSYDNYKATRDVTLKAEKQIRRQR